MMEPVLNIHELMIAIQVVLILVFLFTLGLLFYSFREYKALADKTRWKKLLDDYLIKSIVTLMEQSQQVDPSLENLCKRQTFRRFFIGQLIESERRFTGTAAKTIMNIFYIYGLDKEAYQMLSNSRPYLIARGIQALTVMQVREALQEIRKTLDHPSEIVSQEAQLAIVYFEGFNGLSFLYGVETIISEWQQLRILNSIKVLPEDAVTTLLEWLHSTNVSVIRLALKIIRKFQLFEMEGVLLERLENSDHRVQEELVRTLFSIEQVNTSTALLAYFPKATIQEQFSIIRGLGQIRALDKLDFLKEQLLAYPNPEGKVLIAEAMASMGQIPFLMELREQLLPQDQTRLVLNHALKSKI